MYDVTYMPESWGMKTLLYPPTPPTHKAAADGLEQAVGKAANTDEALLSHPPLTTVARPGS